jgi:hypothetical protein
VKDGCIEDWGNEMHRKLAGCVANIGIVLANDMSATLYSKDSSLPFAIFPAATLRTLSPCTRTSKLNLLK